MIPGHGVGDPSASATDAMILTIVQEVFSRLTTILGAYYFGISLFPEAKTYRFLADVLNDSAILLDSVSPLLASKSIPSVFPGSSLRIATLCLSGACRALCGIVAGGSKTALTIHFSEDGKVPGDIGDLNAKDGSRETVLSLLGMLSGTVVLRYLSTPAPTYVTLFVLIAGHLLANYLAVRAVTMRTLNCQRISLAWVTFYTSYTNTLGRPLGYPDTSQGGERQVIMRAPSPEHISSMERILFPSRAIRNREGSRVVGHATFASSLSQLVRTRLAQVGYQDYLESVMALHTAQKYIILTDELDTSLSAPLTIQIFLKEGHAPLDKLRAWSHAVEIGARWGSGVSALEVIEAAYRAVDSTFPTFVEKMREAGWNTDKGLVAPGPSRTISIYDGESKKEL
ncbi:DUF647-domain-containing protein [Heliocybe sulcata]|uniref:DUF647-domain-containing protein n=1 Tax=Heliocybe sulcata TaxID=5364 RepID=A0A5C3MWQ0_9AGAM|nr:DUF647-domain-containing protein [Heliocybe sulcata]